MKIRAQIGMVLNLDKCIGCHTCSITCKNVWTSREGMEYAWFNNVETKPGIGYPKEWENQKRWHGGWERLPNGAIRPKQGGKWRLLAKIFGNPHLPEIDDYYEPWTYDYEHLQTAPESRTSPIARPVSAITGERMEKITGGPNWEEILGGEFEKRSRDYNFEEVQKEIYGEFENTFMMYLPRLCEHCLNPACVASCPTGAIYKREEDGIVLIDQDKCRGWRMCVSGCPYKKIYYNWKSGKSEKCLFCYPRIESGLPTVCSETCVGRIRYLGVVLYDADRIKEAASVASEQELYEAQTAIFQDPNDPAVERQALADGVPSAWIEAARRSPVYKMAMEWRVAFPLHPEYRTLPMVWYVPPLSPVQAALERGVVDQADLIPAVESLRIPMRYLANLLTGGKEEPVVLALKRMLAMRAYMKRKNVDGIIDARLVEAVGMTQGMVEEMYRIMAIANYEERYVIPTAHREQAEDAYELRGGCGFSFGDGCASGGISGGVAGAEGDGLPDLVGSGPHAAPFAAPSATSLPRVGAAAGAGSSAGGRSAVGVLGGAAFDPARALGIPATGTLVTRGNLFSRTALREKVRAAIERRQALGIEGPTIDADGRVRPERGRFGSGLGQELPGMRAPQGGPGPHPESGGPSGGRRHEGGIGPALSGAGA